MLKRLILLVAAIAAPALPAENVKIVVTGMPPEAVREFQGVSPAATVVAAEKDELVAEAADADAILGTINPQIFGAAKKLRWVQVFSAGVEGYRFPGFVESGVVLTNAKILQGPNIADHAFAMLLALTRQLYRSFPARDREEWRRDGYSMVELRGKTAVVIGVGGIGTQIAQRAQAFGMTVIGVDPKDMPLNPYVGRMVYPDRLDSVLPKADVVFISAPLTPQSQGMMGPRQFELLKPGGYFIAVSRGKLYDTDALVKALDSKRLAGAGLDVTNPEPLPKGHPLWRFENVVITPHMAGHSDHVQERIVALVKENIARFVKGEPLLNVVDKQKGY
ncbi:MAG TPA: D-2-hydroxyacid dehydrogenase [Bryobacteraceae bacterium]|nr:D-2-hydroxyacid dehydrogenase [Bryobacteraceae bacterium]